MDEEIRDLLNEKIKGEIEQTFALEDRNEKTQAIDNLVKLYKLKIDEEKAEWDFDEKYDARMREENLKKEQLAESVKDRYVRMGLEAAGIILPMVFYACWMQKGFKFEETGTYTSATFKNLFGKFKPTK